MKASISLYGTCVTDNVFYYASMDGKNPYLIRNRFFQISPISLMMSEVVVPLLDCEPTGRFESAIKSIKMDIRKNVFDVLEKRKSDYFIIDVNQFDYEILQIEHEGHIYYLTWMNEAKSYSSKVIFDTLKQNNATWMPLRRDDNLGLFEDSITLFCKKLCTIYDPSKIILVKTKSTNLCIHNDGTLDCIFNAEHDDQYISKAFQLFMEKLPGCHVVDTLKDYVSSYDTKYGIGIYHYDKCYYQYCLECINVITDSLSINEEKNKIKQLQEIYSQKMGSLHKSGIDSLIIKNKKIREKNSYDLFRIKQLETLSGTWLERIRHTNEIIDTYVPLTDNGKTMYQFLNLNDYIKFLVENGEGYVLFFAVMDSAAKFWTEFTERTLLGLAKNINNRTSYLAVVDIDKNRTTEIYADTIQEIKYKCSIFVEDRSIITNNKPVSLCFHVSLSSKAWEYKNVEGEFLCWAKIMINNVDYAINRRGLNVVVFSKREHCVVDSFHVDMHADAALRIRR